MKAEVRTFVRFRSRERVWSETNLCPFRWASESFCDGPLPVLVDYH